MRLIKTLCICILLLFLPQWIFSSENAEIIWRYTTGGRIITPPVEGADGTIYFCSEDRFLYALKTDGSIKWRLNLEDRVTETLTIGFDGTLYAGSRRGFLIAVNPFGKQIWRTKLKGFPVGNPAAAPDGSLFLATNKGWLYSISHTGFIRWEVKLPAGPLIGPVLGSEIYIALNNERIYSYDINGEKKWTFILSGNAEVITLSMDNIYVGTDNSTLVSIDFDGTRIWNISMSGLVSAVIVLTNDRIVCSSGNNIIMLNSEGKYIWNIFQRRSQIDLSVYSDVIISLDSEGSIYWIDLDGLPVSQIIGGPPIKRFLSSTDGNIYLGSKDWLLYKVGFMNIINSNYKKYIWPSCCGGINNRAYLSTNKIEQQNYETQQSSDYTYLIEMSKCLDEKILSSLLDELQYRLYKKDYDPGKTYLNDILELLASEAITRPLYEEGRLINNFPIIRSRAIDTLGITGSLETIEFLVDLLNYEWDEYALSSIFKSLGKLKSDIDGNISFGISNYYNIIKNANQRYFNQILLAVQNINYYNGSTNIKLLAVLTDIFLNSSNRSTKEFALDTINSIKK